MIRLSDEPSGPAPVTLGMGDIFGAQGLLCQRLGLQDRPQQLHMASAVQACFQQKEALLVEAGTGVGKSLAYLIPGLLEASAGNYPLVVSTHTIALQEQILQHDLERVRELLRAHDALRPWAAFKVALLVGRGNYLCGTRLQQALANRADLFATTQAVELERLATWARHSPRGLIQELDPPPSSEVWEWVSADSHACNAKNCSPDTCFYRRARQELRDARLIVVNHSLLFTLLSAGAKPQPDTPGILFPHDALVLDEAHTVPQVATEHFGENLSSYGLRRALLRLHHPAAKKSRGLLASFGDTRELRAVEACHVAIEQFFAQVEHHTLADKDLVRLHQEDWAEDTLSGPLAEVIRLLGQRREKLEEGPLRDEVDGQRQLLLGYRASLIQCLALAQEDHVYWVERTGRRQSTVHLRSAPLDVAPYLREHLFQRQSAIVLTSATLAEGPDMASFQSRVGAHAAETLQVGSPFDYDRQMHVFLATDAPTHTPGQGRLDLDYLADMVGFCSLAVEGGTLVLFTSYSDLDNLVQRLEPQFRAHGRPLLVQGKQGSRTELVRRLRDLGNAILFGTESFWTGVDVPGPALSQVIITRLPFRAPTHPIEEARAERCRDLGGNPFRDLALPDALIRFRQGIGRLIRDPADTGRVTVLDSRVLHKEYGRAFLAVLPTAAISRFNRQDRDLTFRLPAR